MTEIQKVHKPLINAGKFNNRSFDDEMKSHGVVTFNTLCYIASIKHNDKEQEDRVFDVVDDLAELVLNEASQYDQSLTVWEINATGGGAVGYEDMCYDPKKDLFFTGKPIIATSAKNENLTHFQFGDRMDYDPKSKTAIPYPKLPQVIKIVDCKVATKPQVKDYAIHNLWNDTLMKVGFSLKYEDAVKARSPEVSGYFKPLPFNDRLLGMKGYLTVIDQ